MIYILKHDQIDNHIVGRLDENIFEFDDEILGRILEEVWDQDIRIREGNKKIKTEERREKIKARLYNPYFLSEDESPEFEIYRYKKVFELN